MIKLQRKEINSMERVITMLVKEKLNELTRKQQ